MSTGSASLPGTAPDSFHAAPKSPKTKKRHKKKPKEEDDSVSENLRIFLSSRVFNGFMWLVIFANMAVIALDSDNRINYRDGVQNASWIAVADSSWIRLIDRVCLGIYCAELIARSAAGCITPFWQRVDSGIVVLGIAGELVEAYLSDPGLVLRLFRAIRAIRILRILRQLLIATMFELLSSETVFMIAKLLIGGFVMELMLSFVFALFGMEMLHDDVRRKAAEGAFDHVGGKDAVCASAFSSIYHSFTSLVGVMTLDQWSDVVFPIATAIPGSFAFFLVFVLCTASGVVMVIAGTLALFTSSTVQNGTDAKIESMERRLQERMDRIERRVQYGFDQVVYQLQQNPQRGGPSKPLHHAQKRAQHSGSIPEDNGSGSYSQSPNRKTKTFSPHDASGHNHPKNFVNVNHKAIQKASAKSLFSTQSGVFAPPEEIADAVIAAPNPKLHEQALRCMRGITAGKIATYEKADTAHFWSDSVVPLRNFGEDVFKPFECIRCNYFISHCWMQANEWEAFYSGENSKYEYNKAFQLYNTLQWLHQKLASPNTEDAPMWEDFVCWVDKACVPQFDAESKHECIVLIEEFLKLSQGLIVLLSWHYFSRLWCIFEWACFVALHDPRDVQIGLSVFLRRDPTSTHSTYPLLMESIEDIKIETSECFNKADKLVLQDKISRFFAGGTTSESFAHCERFTKYTAICLLAREIILFHAVKDLEAEDQWMNPLRDVAFRLGFNDLYKVLLDASPQAWNEDCQKKNEGYEDVIEHWFERAILPGIIQERQRAVRKNDKDKQLSLPPMLLHSSKTVVDLLMAPYESLPTPSTSDDYNAEYAWRRGALTNGEHSALDFEVLDDSDDQSKSVNAHTAEEQRKGSSVESVLSGIGLPSRRRKSRE